MTFQHLFSILLFLGRVTVSNERFPRLSQGKKGIAPRKSLGQNFLRDVNIARKIVAALAPAPDDLMLEIGPGEGALTRFLAGNVKRLGVVDIDRRVIARLQETFPSGEVEIIHDDFLNVDFPSVIRLMGGDATSKVRVVGNIPYNITSPILFHVLDNRERICDLTIMVQREVARRMAADIRTKEYGILSIFCGWLADVDILFDVAPGAFHPVPKVVSSVVRLAILDEPRFRADDEKFFRTMVRGVFGKRRKTLRNSLSYLSESAADIVGDAGLLARRPEELTIGELVELSNLLTRSRIMTQHPA